MNYKERIKAVREAFDPSVLAEICMAEESYFEKYGKAYKEDGGKGRFAFYCNEESGSDILGVAHMDSVQKGKEFGFAKYIGGREIVLSPTLDDRLGCYVICELLPKLGIKTDILLTTDEERGQSTARHFATTKTYKWMYQFDRMGDDVVMYQFDTQGLREKLVECGLKCGTGSASDISKLGDLGCSGMNFGVGYQDYHDRMAWADLEMLFAQVAKFMKFHHKYQREHLVYEKKTTHTTTTTTYTTYPSEPRTYHSGSDWDSYETEFGARRNGIWMQKMIYDERTHMYVPNLSLYKRFPTVKLPTIKRILDANERWDDTLKKFVYCNGLYTEEQILKAAEEALKLAGHTQVVFPLALLEKHKKETQQLAASSNSSSSSELTEGAIDDPCLCGHSRFVHHRSAWEHGKLSMTGCDWWKCTCKSFEMSAFSHVSDIGAGS